MYGFRLVRISFNVINVRKLSDIKAKSKAKLRQIYLKHRRDHQKLLQHHLKEEATTEQPTAIVIM